MGIMKKLILPILFAVLMPSYAGAQEVTASLKKYLKKSFTSCPGSDIKLEKMPNAAPEGFTAWRTTHTSTETRCGRATFTLVSKTSSRVYVVDVFPLPADGRTAEVKIAELGQKILQKPVKVSIGSKLEAETYPVYIETNTPYGTFNYRGFLDSSRQFAMFGKKGLLSTEPGATLLKSLRAETAPARGPKDAKNTIFELSDFQCPTCARAHEIFEPYLKKHASKIRYRRMDLPLFTSHEWAFPAAMGSRAIQSIAPAKYWEYVDYIFRSQSAITKDNVETFVRDFADANGISWVKVRAFMGSPAERQALLDHVARIFDTGIVGTPTYIVNGQPVFYGTDGDHLKAHLDSLLGKKKSGK